MDLSQSAVPVCIHMRPGTVEDQEEPRTQCASVGSDIPVPEGNQAAVG